MGDMTQREALEDLRSFMSGEMGVFDASEIYPFRIGEVDGLAIDIAGEMFADHMLGLIVVVYHHDGASFEVIAVASDDHWLLDGAFIVDQILQSVVFFAPTPMENFRPVSTDPTYGYSEDNPIGVGTGDIYVGPSLEREYLDRLLGPRGEEIEYVRRGSIDTGETIVDAYEITIGYSNEIVVLYLDEYNLDPYVIPQGFACAWSFE